MISQSKKLLAGACAVVVLASAAATWVFGHDLRVGYHLRAKKRAKEMAYKVGAGDSRQSDYIDAWDRHRDALVELGYVEYREFPLEHIGVGTIESRRLWEELCASLPEYADAAMEGYEEETPPRILIWDVPEDMPAPAEIIRAHDQPPAGPPGQAVLDAPQLRPWIGSWADEEGNHVLDLTGGPDGRLTLAMPMNEPWRVVIKNVHVDGCRVTFDAYNYTDPKDEYRTINNPSGEHPFSGVRCRSVLTMDPADPDHISYSARTMHLPEGKGTVLTRLP